LYKNGEDTAAEYGVYQSSIWEPPGNWTQTTPQGVFITNYNPDTTITDKTSITYDQVTRMPAKPWKIEYGLDTPNLFLKATNGNIVINPSNIEISESTKYGQYSTSIGSSALIQRSHIFTDQKEDYTTGIQIGTTAKDPPKKDGVLYMSVDGVILGWQHYAETLTKISSNIELHPDYIQTGPDPETSFLMMDSLVFDKDGNELLNSTISCGSWEPSLYLRNYHDETWTRMDGNNAHAIDISTSRTAIEERAKDDGSMIIWHRFNYDPSYEGRVIPEWAW
jgi:hypothetical protein